MVPAQASPLAVAAPWGEHRALNWGHKNLSEAATQWGGSNGEDEHRCPKPPLLSGPWKQSPR